ncbi:TIGR02270 family protein [Pseudoduganella namucuonensis]|uniref:TIGR02270 family protein n=1 Tax=Pseudoduganella namucuonensis TaxID=1035707 RepID=A0A1I7KPW8_9BURK|nr:TIGR02270 family protein [Pseudoduganella namucuonensis]SFU99478.1 conserved hypothetical protein [Pseudoduganella namucuonensis]
MDPDRDAVIASIVHIHAQETASLWQNRRTLIAAPGVKLHGLDRHDERLRAHLDGMAEAGDFGATVCAAALRDPGPGELFLATVRALEERDRPGLDKLELLVQARPATLPGFIAAFGWVSAQYLQGTINLMLAATNAFQRTVGIRACVMHRVDPGPALGAALADADPGLRTRALRAVGECGRRDLLPACLAELAGEGGPAPHFWAAWSAVLCGDRGPALGALAGHATRAGPWQARALRLALKAVEPAQAHRLLQTLAQQAAQRRLLIAGAGLVGDPSYVRWLLSQMHDPKLDRAAGEAFSLITGLDLGLSHLRFDRPRPGDATPGPGDDPADDNVAMDEDEGLPWPDPSKLHAWWEAGRQRYPPGARHFMGEPVTIGLCAKVLRDGCQRQRADAAEHLCLLAPGTPLFPTGAPAWRQRRWLRQMG